MFRRIIEVLRQTRQKGIYRYKHEELKYVKINGGSHKFKKKCIKCGAGEGWKKNGWTDHVRNEEVLFTVNERRNILHEIRKREANWIGHILRKNCLLKEVKEGKTKGEMEVKRRRGRRRKKLLDDLKDRR
jgi:hypothetical protein